MKTATFKKMLRSFNGVAGLYELSEPLKPYAIDENDSEYNYVVERQHGGNPGGEWRTGE